MRWWTLLLVLVVGGPAWAGDEPAAEDAYEPARAKARMEHDDLEEAYRPAWGPAQEQNLAHARLALSFGRYDVAREIALDLVEVAPERADAQTVVGLAWMGTYYERYGLSPAASQRLQGLLVDANGAGLRPEEIAPALARGFVVAPEAGAGTRGSAGVTPEPLARAIEAFGYAYGLAPNDGAALLHAYVAEVERARWEPRRGQLAALRKAVEQRMSGWSPSLQALAWVDRGVDAYVSGKSPDAEAAVEAFAKAEALGSPLGAYDRALVLAFDPTMASRKAEGIAALRALAADPEMAQDRVAARAGLLPTATAWPFGAPPIAWEGVSGELADVVASIGGVDPEGARRTDLGEMDQVTFANGQQALVKPGYAAWVRVGEAQQAPEAVTLDLVAGVATTDGRAPARDLHSERTNAPRARTSRVLEAERTGVQVRLQEVCDEGAVMADSRGAGCPLWMEIRPDPVSKEGPMVAPAQGY